MEDNDSKYMDLKIMKPTSSPVKVGVIGIGNMGWHHARVLSLLKDANLIGVADPNEERGKLAIEQFPVSYTHLTLPTK